MTTELLHKMNHDSAFSFRVMEQDHSPVMRVFVEYDIGKGIA